MWDSDAHKHTHQVTQKRQQASHAQSCFVQRKYVQILTYMIFYMIWSKLKDLFLKCVFQKESYKSTVEM